VISASSTPSLPLNPLSPEADLAEQGLVIAGNEFYLGEAGAVKVIAVQPLTACLPHSLKPCARMVQATMLTDTQHCLRSNKAIPPGFNLDLRSYENLDAMCGRSGFGFKCDGANLHGTR
jgi:hypothetical protein